MARKTTSPRAMTGSNGPAWKPAKGTMTGREYGAAVSAAAKAKGGGTTPPAPDATPETPDKARLPWHK